MSQDQPQVIELPGGTTRTFMVDGHSLVAQFDDAELLRDLLQLNQRITETAASHNAGSPTDETLGQLVALAGEAEVLIDRAFGAGTHALLFGGAKPFMRSLVLITGLAQAAGPVYDQMFAQYRPPAEPATEL